jgi:hypothetical protein
MTGLNNAFFINFFMPSRYGCNALLEVDYLQAGMRKESSLLET